MTREPKVVLDFDGVLHGMNNGWHLRPDMKADPVPTGEPVEGAQVFCQWLIEHGFEPVVYSARMHAGGYLNGVRHMYDWLVRHDFPEMKIVYEKPQDMCLFIDDKGFRFEGDFAAVVQFIEANDFFKHFDSWAKADYAVKAAVVE